MTEPNIEVVLDFETHYAADYTLSRMTTVEYICDPRFKVHMVGLQVGNGKPMLFVGHENVLRAFMAIPWERVDLVCHNIMFDGAVLAWVFGFRPNRYVDTLGMARAIIGSKLAKHGLGEVANYLGFGGKVGYNPNSGEAQALAAVKGNPDPTPAQLEALGYYCAFAENSDIALTRKVYDALRPEFPESEYAVMDWCARMFIDPRLRLDGEMLKQYEIEVRQHKAQLVAESGYPKTYFTSNEQFAALLRLHDVDPPKKWSKTTGKSTYAFSKNDEAFTNLATEHPNPKVRQLVETRLEVKSSIEETRAKTLYGISQIPGSLMPAPINYSGAMNTHRLSGGGGYNVQNFKRGGTLRKAIMAPEGQHVLVADLSGIELRVAIALSDDTQRLELLRQKEDLYCHTATGLFGSLVVKEGQPGYVEDPMKQHRLVGKVADLSLQYGAAKLAFQGMLRVMGKLSWNEDQCEEVVNKWRMGHPDTTRRWNQCGNALRTMAAGGIPQNWPLSTARGQPVFEFHSDGIMLPRGLKIKYPNLRREEKTIMVGEKEVVKKGMAYDDARSAGGMAWIYGGKVFENLCQALATCVYMEQVMAIQAIYPVSLSVHDEVVLVGPYDTLTKLQPLIEHIMRTPPDWWPDLPLDVESDIAVRYGEAK